MGKGGEKMRFTLKEWLDLQRNAVRTCAGPGDGTDHAQAGITGV